MKLVKNDYIWGYISQSLNIGINLLLLPFMVIYLNNISLGLWFNFASIGSLVMLLDFGFSITMARNVSYAWNGATTLLNVGTNINSKKSEPNMELLAKIVSLTQKIYSVIGLIALIILSTVGSIYIYWISKDYLNFKDIFIPWMFYIMAIFLNIFYLYWTPLLRGIGAMKNYYQILSLSKVVQFIVTVILLYFNWGLYGVSIGYFSGIIIARILSKSAFYSYQKKLLKSKFLDIRNVNYKKNEIKELYLIIKGSIYKQGVLSLSNFAIEKSALIVCTLFLGLPISAKYGLSLQAFAVVSTLGNVMFNTSFPKMIKLKSQNKISEAFNIFVRSLKVQFFVIFIGSLGILFLGPWILKLVNSQSSLIDFNEIILLGIYVYLFNFQLQFTNFIIMDNKYPMLSSYIITACLTIILLIIFANEFTMWGVNSLISAQILALSIFNLWYWPKYVINGFTTIEGNKIKHG